MLCPTLLSTTYSSVSFTAIFSSDGISWVVVERFEMSDVGYELVPSDEVTDCVNIFTSVKLTLVISKGPLHQELYLLGPFSDLFGILVIQNPQSVVS